MYDELVNELRDGDAFEICGAYDILRRAADAIENLDYIAGTYAETAHELLEKNRWIPVTERLPSQDGYYLVAYKLDVIPQLWHFNVYLFSLDLYKTDKFDFPRKKYKGKSGFYFYDSEYGNIEDNRVTHWMPLPEPPKEET